DVTYRYRENHCEVLGLANRDDDWKPGSFADEEQMLATADLENVAVPVAEPSRRHDVGRSLCPFQSRQQLACAPENDHRIDSVIHISSGALYAETLEHVHAPLPWMKHRGFRYAPRSRSMTS